MSYEASGCTLYVINNYEVRRTNRSSLLPNPLDA